MRVSGAQNDEADLKVGLYVCVYVLTVHEAKGSTVGGHPHAACGP